jgi:hypothetical protein
MIAWNGSTASGDPQPLEATRHRTARSRNISIDLKYRDCDDPFVPPEPGIGKMKRPPSQSQGVVADFGTNVGCMETADGKARPLPSRNNGGTTNLIIRGVDPFARSLRPDFKIVAGRNHRARIEPGVTSRNIARRFANLAIGEKIEINKVNFEIVGYFDAGGSTACQVEMTGANLDRQSMTGLVH